MLSAVDQFDNYSMVSKGYDNGFKKKTATLKIVRRESLKKAF